MKVRLWSQYLLIPTYLNALKERVKQKEMFDRIDKLLIRPRSK